MPAGCVEQCLEMLPRFETKRRGNSTCPHGDMARLRGANPIRPPTSLLAASRGGRHAPRTTWRAPCAKRTPRGDAMRHALFLSVTTKPHESSRGRPQGIQVAAVHALSRGPKGPRRRQRQIEKLAIVTPGWRVRPSSNQHRVGHAGPGAVVGDRPHHDESSGDPGRDGPRTKRHKQAFSRESNSPSYNTPSHSRGCAPQAQRPAGPPKPI